MWEILTRDVFDSWFEEQNEETQIEVLAVLMILREDGPNLGRPQVDTLKGSQYPNMKELRIQVGGHPIRACLPLTLYAVALCYAPVIRKEKMKLASIRN